MVNWGNSTMDILSMILVFLWLPFAVTTTETIPKLIGSRAEESELANISLVLYTGQTIDEYTSVLIGDALDLLDIIDPKKPTMFYIHGWTEGPCAESVVVILTAYLKRQDHNVILVNWEEIASGSYLDVIIKVNNIASIVAEKLNKLVTAGLDPTTIHVVAHSLGAQIAGFIGREVTFTIPRITGLDPAGPGFNILVEHLTSSDADFVDVIHTDSGLFGTISTAATVNFHPNGGTRFQPGCPVIRLPFSENDFCDHHRSFYYYAESLIKENAFIGVECGTYAAFKLRLCRSNNQVVMGFGTPTTASGNVYLETNSESPFGKEGQAEIYEE